MCSADEASAYRRRLKLLGADRFIDVTVKAGVISAKKLCTAFGIRPPAFLDDAPDAAYLPLLGIAISRELAKRAKLPQYNTVDDAVELLKRSRNIVVLTGAGVSFFFHFLPCLHPISSSPLFFLLSLVLKRIRDTYGAPKKEGKKRKGGNKSKMGQERESDFY